MNSSPPIRVPIRGKRRHTNQQGETKVYVVRHTELSALRHPLIITGPVLTEVEKSTAIYAAYKRAMRTHGNRLRGIALFTWIAGQTGCLISEVRFYLR